MIRSTLLASALSLAAALPVMAEELVRVDSSKPVAETADALVAAIEGAGATVFARVDHAEGARSVDMDLPEAQLVIFGNPALGTPAMQDAIEVGLVLPLRVLVHADGDGGSVLVYQEVEEMIEDAGGDEDGAYVAKMKGALKNLTAKAAE